MYVELYECGRYIDIRRQCIIQCCCRFASFFSIFLLPKRALFNHIVFIFGLWSRAHHKLYGMEKWRDSDSGINAHAECNKWHTISCAILATRYVLSGRCFWATLDKNISLKECLVWRGKIVQKPHSICTYMPSHNNFHGTSSAYSCCWAQLVCMIFRVSMHIQPTSVFLVVFSGSNTK